MRQPLKLISLRWHRWLGWTGGIALLVFALSGITHPIMTWTSPRPVTYRAPTAPISGSAVTQMAHHLNQQGVTKARRVKLVPTQAGLAIQITHDPLQPRTYIDMATGHQLPPTTDADYAVWLARHYTGLANAPVTDRSIQTHFDSAYPWVNRLLPVYRITLDHTPKTTVFIDTELGALASITTPWKTRLQGLFRALHTWQWLDRFNHTRLLLMSGLLLSLIGLSLSGIGLIVFIRRPHTSRRRRIHRSLSILIWIPLLMFSSSGFYHLLHHGLFPSIPEPIVADWMAIPPVPAGPMHTPKSLLTSVTLVQGPGNTLLYRLDRPSPSRPNAHPFDGQPTHQPAWYINAHQGNHEPSITDSTLVEFYANRYMNHAPILDTQRLTRFSALYDFRNKRLPVFQLTYADRHIFIDPKTGTLVEQLYQTDRYERLSFSTLHKWNFLTPWTGRSIRDTLMISFLLISIFSAGIGFWLLLKR
ncbi:MAG: PepSY domain-containing protein [Candidatus Marinamargulisbacteria bacterium]|nr:PepSY domain-containing protein [Candidatus Marinamargulisbacteria bacterium]